MTSAMLHSLAEEMSTAFKGGILTMSKSERIIELAGAQWLGVQNASHALGGPFVMFRDPVTASTLALPEEDVTVSNVLAKMDASRKAFGVNS